VLEQGPFQQGLTAEKGNIQVAVGVLRFGQRQVSAFSAVSRDMACAYPRSA